MTKYLIIRDNNVCYVAADLKPDGKLIGKRLLHFKLFIEGENKYSPLTVKSADGEYVDDYFRVRYKENINIDGSPVFQDEQGLYSVATLEDYSGEKLTVSDFNVDAPPVRNLLNGITLTQLKPHGCQMMGYIIDTVHKNTVVIDGGNYVDGDALEQKLSERGGYVDHWFITHYHDDHIGAIMKVLEHGRIKIGKMYFNFPPASALSAADPKNLDYVDKFLSLLTDKIQVVTAAKGDKFSIDGLTVKVLNDPCFLPRENFANDSGLVFKVETGDNNILFTGDIGDSRGGELLRDENFRREISDCTVVQMSHHGNWGVDNEFYDLTPVKYCLYPTPLWLWNNDRGEGKHTSFWTTLQTRELMRDRNVLKSFTSLFDEDTVIK